MNATLTVVVLMIITIILSEIQKLGIGKDLAYAATRTFIQLMAVGYIIQFVFDMESLIYQILLLTIMMSIAAYTAKGRVENVPHSFLIAFTAIATGTIVTLGLLIVLRLIDTTPRYMIPLGGMIIGNTMNGSALLMDRLYSEMKDKKLLIEAKLALGASSYAASESLIRKSVKASMIPMINSLKVVGLVQLPGAMTGMILAGASPIEATKLQLMVMYMLSVSVTTGIMVVSFLTYRVFFTKDCRIEIQ